MPSFTTFDGLNIHYDDEGEGLPVLCLSGLTRNGRDFDFVAPHLPDVRLIRMDYRGRHRSDRGDWRSYTVPNEARDALGLLDHLGLERVAVIGTSRGGLVAMTIAATARERLIGVALNDVGPELDQAGLTRIMGYLGRQPEQATQEELAHALAAADDGNVNIPHERWLAHARNMTEETEDGLRIAYDPKLRDAVLEGAGKPAPDLWPLFDALRGMPLALIRGKNSDLLTAEGAARMRGRIPAIMQVDVASRGHAPFLDEPEAVALLRRWIRKCRSA